MIDAYFGNLKRFHRITLRNAALYGSECSVIKRAAISCVAENKNVKNGHVVKLENIV